jgi:hypothetical protein
VVDIVGSPASTNDEHDLKEAPTQQHGADCEVFDINIETGELLSRQLGENSQTTDPAMGPSGPDSPPLFNEAEAAAPENPRQDAIELERKSGCTEPEQNAAEAELSERIESLQREHQGALEKLTMDHARELTALSAEAIATESALKQQNHDLRNRLDDAESQRDALIRSNEELIEQHAKDLATIHEAHGTEVKALLLKSDALVQGNDEDNRRHEEVVNDLKTQHQEEKQRMKKDLSEYRRRAIKHKTERNAAREAVLASPIERYEADSQPPFQQSTDPRGSHEEWHAFTAHVQPSHEVYHPMSNYWDPSCTWYHL